MRVINEQGLLPIMIWADEVEEGALNQARNLAKHPVVHHHVALMPDVHQGYGMPIGGVIACKNALIPNAIGVDQGCGMRAVRLDMKYSDYEEALTIEKKKEFISRVLKVVPVGFMCHASPRDYQGLEEYLEPIDPHLRDPEVLFYEKVRRFYDSTSKHKDGKDVYRFYTALGTLGGGNHFIELQRGSDGYLWLMLHSGSRKVGYECAKFYQEMAVRKNAKWCSSIPTDELAFLPMDSIYGQVFRSDLSFSLEYAYNNRSLMMKKCTDILADMFDLDELCIVAESHDVYHNYASLENHYGKNLWVHRKGATSAESGRIGIIPGSMGTKSYIVKGLGNEKSFCSCSHGAGRAMSRAALNRMLSVEEAEAAVGDVVHTKWGYDRSKQLDLSEAPQAYKDISEVIDNERDLIEPIVELEPLISIKG